MDNTWSGAIIYEWIEEANNYGLVSYAPQMAATATAGEGGFIRVGTPLPVSPDFSNLKAQWATLTPAGVALSAYSASTAKVTPPACPSSSANGWLVNGNPPLPTLGQALGSGGTPIVTGAATATGSASASASPTKGSASGGKQIAGMSIGLAGVMLGFIVWL